MRVEVVVAARKENDARPRERGNPWVAWVSASVR
jgi:hypothetical protein